MTKDSLPASVWSLKVPVTFGHCDIAGIVYTPRFFEILHPVIERFFIEALGIDYYDMARLKEFALGYGHASCDFFSPCRMGDELDVAVTASRIGTTSYTLLLHAMKEGREALRGCFVTVVMEMDTFKPKPIPPGILQALQNYQQRCGTERS